MLELLPILGVTWHITFETVNNDEMTNGGCLVPDCVLFDISIFCMIVRSQLLHSHQFTWSSLILRLSFGLEVIFALSALAIFSIQLFPLTLSSAMRLTLSSLKIPIRRRQTRKTDNGVGVCRNTEPLAPDQLIWPPDLSSCTLCSGAHGGKTVVRYFRTRLHKK